MDIKQVFTILITVFVIVALIFAFVYFNRESWFQEESLEQVSASPNGAISSAEGLQFLKFIQSLKSLALDTAIFETPVFKELRDFSQPLKDEPIGRRNPFLPLGQGGGSAVSEGEGETNP